MTKKPRLQLKKSTVRVLTTHEARQIGGARRGMCCEVDTEILDPYTAGGTGGPMCCDLNSQLQSPYTA
jgi:hypothetical protein